MRKFTISAQDAEALATEALIGIQERKRIQNRKNQERRSSYYRSERGRHEVYDKANGHCRMCGEFVPFEDMTMGHIVPRARGGKSVAENLQLECFPCNNGKGDLELAAGEALPTQPRAGAGQPPREPGPACPEERRTPPGRG